MPVTCPSANLVRNAACPNGKGKIDYFDTNCKGLLLEIRASGERLGTCATPTRAEGSVSSASPTPVTCRWSKRADKPTIFEARSLSASIRPLKRPRCEPCLPSRSSQPSATCLS